MPDLWRISNHIDLSGEGGLRYSARWHSAGRRIVYLAESPAGALIEVLVHLKSRLGQLPPPYTLLRVVCPANLVPHTIDIPGGHVWSDLNLTRSLGDAWFACSTSALARVPSSILPHTFNILLNPLHPDAPLLTIAEATHASFDPRLGPFAQSEA